MKHKPKVVKAGLPGNGPRKPMAIDCSCGWMGVLHSQLDPKCEESARKEQEEHASEYE